MPHRRKLPLTIAWVTAWALIFVFATAMPGWLAIALAVGTFAAFVLLSREPSACLAPGVRGCESPGVRARDASRTH